MDNRPRVRVPSTARPGEVVEIRTLIDHPMETGLRRGENGERVPRDMLARFVARADGVPVFTAEFRNATSANPYLVFGLRVERSTDLAFEWTHEDGRATRTAARIEVA